MVLIVYKLKEIYSGSSGSPNAFEFPTDSDSEIYLIEILNYLKDNFKQTIGYNYSFYVEFEKKLHLIESPSSLITIRNGRIDLLLVPSNSPPIVPLEQLTFFRNYSRQCAFNETKDDFQNIHYIEAKRNRKSNNEVVNLNEVVTNDVSLQSIVGQEAAIVLNEASEVAREVLQKS
jgi:hypothetical protein